MRYRRRGKNIQQSRYPPRCLTESDSNIVHSTPLESSSLRLLILPCCTVLIVIYPRIDRVTDWLADWLAASSLTDRRVEHAAFAAS